MTGFNDLEKKLQERESNHLYRRRRLLESAQGREIRLDGRTLLNFCSNDYLGLAADKRVVQSFHQGADRWGVGSGASHLVCGHTEAHHELEAMLAEFTGRPRALLFSSGYAANVGAINALLGKGDLVLEDRLNHASLLDGGISSGATFKRFRHRDCNRLSELLDTYTENDGRKLVVSDGTFSMDGTQCDVAGLATLTHKHSAWLMIDDAHGMGVYGREGRGLVDHARFDTTDVPVLVGTLGKAFGTQGGFVAGEAALIETLIQHARTYIYSTALPAAVAVATQTSLDIARKEQWRRDRLAQLVKQFRTGAQQIGLQLTHSSTPIQPILLGNEADAIAASNALEKRGLLVMPIRPPTVPAGTSRLRVTFTANHTGVDVNQLLSALADTCRVSNTHG